VGRLSRGCEIESGRHHTFMKNIVAALACSFLLAGCGKDEPQNRQPASAVSVGFTNDLSVGFTKGSSRDAIVRQLEQMQATILIDSPELLSAEFRASKAAKPMQVELGFRKGKLLTVNYIPQ